MPGPYTPVGTDYFKPIQLKKMHDLASNEGFKGINSIDGFAKETPGFKLLGLDHPSATNFGALFGMTEESGLEPYNVFNSSVAIPTEKAGGAKNPQISQFTDGLFAVVDKDGDGFLDQTELAATFGTTITDLVLNNGSIDDGDSKISKDEFSAFIEMAAGADKEFNINDINNWAAPAISGANYAMQLRDKPEEVLSIRAINVADSEQINNFVDAFYGELGLDPAADTIEAGHLQTLLGLDTEEAAEMMELCGGGDGIDKSEFIEVMNAAAGYGFNETQFESGDLELFANEWFNLNEEPAA